MIPTNIYSLFEGRHQLPANKGAICSDFDFDRFKAVKTFLWDEALSKLKAGEDVTIIVTGLTPALTEFLSDVMNYEGAVNGQLILQHYNKDKNMYIEQVMLHKVSDKKIIRITYDASYLGEFEDKIIIITSEDSEKIFGWCPSMQVQCEFKRGNDEWVRIK